MYRADTSAGYVGLTYTRNDRGPHRAFTSSPRGWRESVKRRSLAHMWSQRSVAHRRPAMRSSRVRRSATGDACDPPPSVRRAIPYRGGRAPLPGVRAEERDQRDLCPRRRARSSAEKGRGCPGPRDATREYRKFRVNVVMVCQGGGWNHLTVSFVLGTETRHWSSGLDGTARHPLPAVA
ncbi:DUF5318 family protein [Thermostaphylospora chromogena]|uniref:DUF5318 family protein n=1 Tax=Thermostaphylospora chromogena TaxID=35622 RepID=UPI003BFA1287